MRHYLHHDLLARPPLPLAPGMCMTAFAAVLVALTGSTLAQLLARREQSALQ